MKRREFLQSVPCYAMRWLPWMGLAGFQFHRYTFGPAAGYVGWITWCGRVVGYVPL